MKNTYITNNFNFGFYGTLKLGLPISDIEAEKFFTLAGKIIAEAHDATADEIVILLDSRTGRYIADEIADEVADTGLPAEDCIEKIVKNWRSKIVAQLKANANEMAAQHLALAALLTHTPATRQPEIHRAYRKAVESIQELLHVLHNAEVEACGNQMESYRELVSQVKEMLRG